MQTNTSLAIKQICEMKNIDKKTVVDAMLNAIKIAYKKDYGTKEQEIEVEWNEKTDEIKVFLIREVVDKINPEIPEDKQILLKDAKKIKKDIKVGERLKEEVTPPDYRRIAAQSAKQVFIQKIREAEKNMLYDYYNNLKGNIVSGIIKSIEKKAIYVELDKSVAIMTPKDQIPNEKYFIGQHLKVYIYNVIPGNRTPAIYVSRSKPEFIAKLMEIEVPEIAEGDVLIKKIAREPGVRSKVAVITNDDDIDPVGACVGQRGIRIQNVMDEINGEFIDVIEWTDNVLELTAKCLAPASITKMYLSNEERRIRVFVDENQRSLAIGKKGQNVKLASMMSGYEIDIITSTELEKFEATIAQSSAKDFKPESEVVSAKPENDEEEFIHDESLLPENSTENIENEDIKINEEN